MAEGEEPVEQVVEFHDWLKEHRYGALSEEMAEAVAEVVQAVSATGKKGSVTLKLTIEAKGRSVLLVDKVETTVPKPDREASIYFADATGNLVRDDPVQMKLPGTEPVRAERETGEIVRLVRDQAVGDDGNDGNDPDGQGEHD